MSIHVVDPDFTDILYDHKAAMLSEFHCHQIGEISSYDKDTQTAEIKIKMKAMLQNGDTISYPLLVDCPVFVIQGGGAYVEFPIAEGDECIVLFNDRDIDNWFAGANKEPNTGRKHSLADGIAIVGINAKDKTFEMDGEIVKIITNDNPFKIDAGSKDISIVTTGNLEVTDTNSISMSAVEKIELKDAAKIDMLGATESFVNGDTLYNQLNTIITALQTFATGLNPTTLAAQASTLASAMGTALGLLSQIKSTKIKGE